MANIPDDVKLPFNELMDRMLRSAGGTSATQGIDWAGLIDRGIDSSPTFGDVSALSLSSAAAALLPIVSSVADAGTAIKLAAAVDLTSGKIVTIGDNNTAAYAEKAYFDYAGVLFTPGLTSASAATLPIVSTVADAGTAVKIAASVDMATGKLLTIGDNDAAAYAEKAYFDVDGGLHLPILAASTNVRTDVLASNSSTFLSLEGSIANGASAVALKLSNINALSTNGAKIASFYKDQEITEEAYVDIAGFLGKSVFGTAPVGTGITVDYVGGRGTNFTLKMTVDYTNFTTNGNNHDVVLWTVPAKTRVLRVVADITAGFTDGAGPITTMVLTVGKTAGGNTYLVGAAPIDAMTPGTHGLVAADAGTDLGTYFGDVPSWSVTTDISARFAADSPVATLGVTNLTAGSATFYIDCVLYP